MKTTTTRRPLLPLLIVSICLIFLSINGFIGSYFMLSNPTGEVMGMPLSILERTPFQSWVVPGLFLLLLWGCGSLVVLASLWLRPNFSLFEGLSRITHEHWAWVLAVALGLALLVWLLVQLFTLPAVAPIQYILAGLALVLVIVPLLPGMRDYYELPERQH